VSYCRHPLYPFSLFLAPTTTPTTYHTHHTHHTPQLGRARLHASPLGLNKKKDGDDDEEEDGGGESFMAMVNKLHVRSSDDAKGSQYPQGSPGAGSDAKVQQPAAAHRLTAQPGRKLDRAREHEPALVTPDDEVKGKLNVHQLRALLASAAAVAAGGAAGLQQAADKYGLDAADVKALLEHYAEPAPEKFED
jgi:hypothetical protein